MLNWRQRNLANDFVLPTLLFASLGGMSWAVRGTRGFGGMAGCVFAGVLWGVAWWFCARDPAREQSRRYSSGWVVLALTFGIGLAGGRGWRQWSHFFLGELYTNFDKHESVPISSKYGFLWLFIAGVPWAGLGACFLAWCGSRREVRVWHWMLRIGFGIGAAMLARSFFDGNPQYFLPLYSSIEAKYNDLGANPDLQRIINDCGLAITHLGYYLGFLLFEIVRREWKNVVLILTVGILNGLGWAALQNWEWAPSVWHDMQFAWWRCWESTGGISIGIAYGVAYFLVNRKMNLEERMDVQSHRRLAGPSFEWLLVFSGLTALASVFAGILFGWTGTIRWGQLNVSPDVAQLLQNHFSAWSGVYFAIVLLFGAAYYFLYRKTPYFEPAPHRKLFAMLLNIEVGALCVVGALLVPLFADHALVKLGAKVLQLDAVDDAGQYWQTDAPLQIRLAYIGAVILCGFTWYLFDRRAFDEEKIAATPLDGDRNLERLGVYLGVLAGLAVSLLNGVTGWFKTYRGFDDSIARVLWHLSGPICLALLVAILGYILFRPLPRDVEVDAHRRAGTLMWFVLIFQNVIAQFVTGPMWQWREFAFNLYYVLLFIISAIIVYHIQTTKSRELG